MIVGANGVCLTIAVERSLGLIHIGRSQRRAQILRAAAQAFSHDGFVATSVDEVAKQAGITKLIVYRHFDSKADLYRSILDEVTGRLVEEWVAAIERLDDPAAYAAASNAAWPREALLPFYPQANRLCEAGDFNYAAAGSFRDGGRPMIEGFESPCFSSDTLERFSCPTDFGCSSCTPPANRSSPPMRRASGRCRRQLPSGCSNR